MDFAQEVKAAADIVTIIGQHVRLRRQGADRFVGLCPFHAEKTPSFSVHRGLQIYKCFGCGKSGDVFTFLMEIQGLSFFEALKQLAERQGRPLPRSSRGPGADTAARKREALHLIHDMAQEFFVGQLGSPRGTEALRYLRDRGIAGTEITGFGLGYAPAGNALIRHMKDRGFKRSDVLDSGLVGVSQDGGSHYDRFRGRLMIPIHADNGKVIAYGGRILAPDKQPKYLNSPQTPIYSKNAVLFNLHRARTAIRQGNLAVLVEGYMDVIGVWRAGIRNAVATCGTALTSRQIGVLRRHCDTVIVNFDSDAAGQTAAERSVELLLREGMNVRVLELPGGMDPDEFCRASGADEYRSELERAPRYFQWLLDRSRNRFDLATAEGRKKAFEWLLEPVKLLPDEIQRATTVTELAEHIGLDEAMAMNRLRLATKRRDRVRDAPARPTVEGMSHSEMLLVVLLATSEQARAELLEDAVRTAENGLSCRPILAAMMAVSKAGGGFQYAAVEGRLESEDRERMARLVFDKDRPAPTIDEGRDALAALQRRVVAERYREIRRRIARAERSGKPEEIAQLLHERVRLERELGLASGRPS